MLIELHRCDKGTRVLINPNNITQMIEGIGCTLVDLCDGGSVYVSESYDEIVKNLNGYILNTASKKQK